MGDRRGPGRLTGPWAGRMCVSQWNWSPNLLKRMACICITLRPADSLRLGPLNARACACGTHSCQTLLLTYQRCSGGSSATASLFYMIVPTNHMIVPYRRWVSVPRPTENHPDELASTELLQDEGVNSDHAPGAGAVASISALGDMAPRLSGEPGPVSDGAVVLIRRVGEEAKLTRPDRPVVTISSRLLRRRPGCIWACTSATSAPPPSPPQLRTGPCYLW